MTPASYHRPLHCTIQDYILTQSRKLQLAEQSPHLAAARHIFEKKIETAVQYAVVNGVSRVR